jgi:DNA-binding SARP family transcriptional activator
MSGLRLKLLGGFELRSASGAAVPLSVRKPALLLAYLALRLGQPQGRDKLAGLFWGGSGDAQARTSLRQALAVLRRQLGPHDAGLILAPEGETVALAQDSLATDVAEFERCLASGTRDALKRAVALYEGDLLDGFQTPREPLLEEWLVAERQRLREAVLTAMTALLPDVMATGTPDMGVRLALRVLALDPLQETAHRALMRLHAQQGRRGAALTRYQTLRETLTRELGVTPEEETQRLYKELRDQRGAPDNGAAAPMVEVAGAQGDRPARGSAIPPAVAATDGRDGALNATPRRASIAVMPFVDRSAVEGVHGGAADALAHDVITRLAKLRTLFVIAQGTVFALHEQRIGAEEAGRMLGVDYVVGGWVRHHGGRLTVSVELAEVPTARIVWMEVFDHKRDDAFLVLDGIGDRIVASVAGEIETIERNRAVLRPPDSLDAWGAHHRGLWHMYRFSRADNELARHFFETAVRLDPTFSRAHAGLSFTHFQNAFQGWAEHGPETDRAFEAAGRSLMADDRDPAAHWAMGRALWLRGRHDQSIAELEQAVELSPNFALGHYMLAFVHSLAGDPHAAIASADHSRHLSPFDPLLFGILASRAAALVRLGRFEEAAQWSVKAAARPNAHAHILAIAAYSLALAGRPDEARAHLASVHKASPGYRVDDLIVAMRLAPEGERLFREGAKRIGA